MLDVTLQDGGYEFYCPSCRSTCSLHAVNMSATGKLHCAVTFTDPEQTIFSQESRTYLL